MDILILTPISVEYQAIKKQLDSWDSNLHHGFECGVFQGTTHEFKIAIQETGSKNSVLALATEKAVQKLNPKIILLVGVAGGVKDPKVGDLVIGTKAYGYESGKVTAEGFLVRPEVIPYDLKLIELARSIAEDKQWIRRIADATLPAVIFGPIASGDKVITTRESEVYDTIFRSYNDTQALEMEAIGFAQAALHYPTIRCLNIRGISDRLDGKSASDAEGSQPKAAELAAAFAFELLYQLDFSKLNFPEMDIKELSKKVFELIFPLIKMESVKEIGHEFEDASNTTIRELWQKIKPLFIEEFNDLKADPADTDLQGALRAQLKKKLTADDDLCQQLTALVEKAETTPEGKVIISNSKNVIQGSNISVGGDFRLGDG